MLKKKKSFRKQFLRICRNVSSYCFEGHSSTILIYRFRTIAFAVFRHLQTQFAYTLMYVLLYYSNCNLRYRPMCIYRFVNCNALRLRFFHHTKRAYVFNTMFCGWYSRITLKLLLYLYAIDDNAKRYLSIILGINKYTRPEENSRIFIFPSVNNKHYKSSNCKYELYITFKKEKTSCLPTR